ncbi:hypothetical protein ACY1J9_001353 [Clostridium botulinum]
MNEELSNIIDKGFRQLWFNRGNEMIIYYRSNHNKHTEDCSISYYIYNKNNNSLTEEKRINLIEAMYISKLYDDFW